jgi:hypothetical protein
MARKDNDVLDDFNFENEEPEFGDHLYLDHDTEAEVVARFYSGMEANVAAALLRSEGIPCFLGGTMGQSVTPHLQDPVRLHVRPEDFEASRLLLRENGNLPNDEAENADEQNQQNMASRFLVMLAIIVSIIFVVLLLAAM